MVFRTWSNGTFAFSGWQKVTLEPYVLRGNIWALDFNNGTSILPTPCIPGLAYSAPEKRFQGRIDAIAAVAKLTGRPMPAMLARAHCFMPAQKILYAYQLEGIASVLPILKKYGGALLADDMGLGKSRQAAAIAKQMGGRTFIVCPASVRETWLQELKTLGVKEDDVFLAAPGWKTEVKTTGRFFAPYIITSYELADQVYTACFGNNTPKLMVLDECHMLAGRNTKRFAKLRKLAALMPYKLGLTGTPMFDRPRDLWAVMDVLISRVFGSKYDFDFAYCAGVPGQHGGVDNEGISNAEELKLRLSYYMVRRLKSEVGHQMPKLTRQIIWTAADATATRAFQSAIITRSPGSTTQALEAALESKIPEALRLASEAGRFLLTTHRKEHAQRMAAELNQMGVECHLITGAVPHKQRQIAIRDAAATGTGIVATMDSLFQGVDGLQHVASTLIAHSLDWRPKKLAQLEKRLDRTGQKFPVTAYYLAARESMDARVLEVALPKIGAESALFDGTETGLADTLSTPEESRSEADIMRELYSQLPEEETTNEQ